MALGFPGSLALGMPPRGVHQQNGGEDTDDDPCGIPGSGAMGASERSKKQRRLVPLVGVPLFRRAAPDT